MHNTRKGKQKSSDSGEITAAVLARTSPSYMIDPSRQPLQTTAAKNLAERNAETQTKKPRPPKGAGHRVRLLQPVRSGELRCSLLRIDSSTKQPRAGLCASCIRTRIGPGSIARSICPSFSWLCKPYCPHCFG